MRNLRLQSCSILIKLTEKKGALPPLSKAIIPKFFQISSCPPFRDPIQNPKSKIQNRVTLFTCFLGRPQTWETLKLVRTLNQFLLKFLALGQPLLYFVMGLSFVIMFSVFSPPSLAQINQAIIQEILDGDQVFIQENQAKVEDQANFGQVVYTEASRASLKFNNGAAGRMGTNARVTVGQCVEVQQGEILVSGPVNGCIAGFTVGVEGTIYLLESSDNGSGTIKVLEGTVQVSASDDTTEPIEVNAGEKVSVLRGILGEVLPLSTEEVVAILSGQLFSGFQIPVTPEGALEEVCSRLLPDFSCSTTGLPIPSIPTPPIPLPF